MKGMTIVLTEHPRSNGGPNQEVIQQAVTAWLTRTLYK